MTTVEQHNEHDTYRKKLAALTPIFAKASIGDFSQDVEIPEGDDELIELCVGIQIMLEVIREQIGELKGLNHTLAANITDLQVANADLKKERAKAEAILASIGEGVVATDEAGRVLFINETAAELLGYSQHELVGQLWHQPIPAMQTEDGATVAVDQTPTYKTVVERRRIVSDRLYYVRKNGQRFPVVKTTTPVELNEKVIGSIAVFRDVTREREIDRAKSEFVSLASHQLRTPLSIIGWYVESLLTGRVGQPSNEQREYLQEIATSNHRLVDLVNALLNVSRIEMGTLMIDPEPTDIGLVLESILHEMQILIEKKSLTINHSYMEQIPSINVDPKVIRIVFHNLLSNAIRYTPNGGSITISIEEQLEKLLVKIADTGVGIPRDEQHKIFTKLFRAENARTKEPDGTGLGLYLAKAIVERSGGSIAFTSAENKGTTFAVALPLKTRVRVAVPTTSRRISNRHDVKRSLIPPHLH